MPGRHATVAELRRVGVQLVDDAGVLKCDRCGTSWNTIECAGEGLSPGYWSCPFGCNDPEPAA